MIFPQEELQNTIDYYEKQLIRLKKQLKEPIKKEKIILWELLEQLKLLPFIDSVSNYGHINIYFKQRINIEELEELYNIIEEILIGYSLDEKDSTEYSLYYKHESLSYIFIFLSLNNCKLINTGKMVAETKQDCSFMKKN